MSIPFLSTKKLAVFPIETGKKLFSKYVGYHITTISSYGLADSSVEEFDFPLLTSIGQYAFQNCSGLTEIEIKAAITSIGNYAFYNCNQITQIITHKNIKTIGKEAFTGCKTNINNL